ncbi:basic leucine zipper transcriptional factor ATF-like 2 isoform X2 [Choloepus didactylus]|uniref:basic leucine zipper transcriptional factor ATF-like 2 isoform X2 n=1 Tax=Choloepus didactylus TaxID=27675 RepID=UPI00189FDA42|nr:basic leucine zipper transcriptional factor ATF-like 2 isoform X2 [Choloepus didactylus]
MHLCGGIELLTGTGPEEHQRQLKKKQKNRAAAQRSRQKHTDKADALHQHESLEKHNHTLQKEIQALQAELEWWSRTLYVHERLCPMAPASCSALEPAGCWDPAKQPLGSGSHRLHSCVEQPDLFRTPASSPPTQQLSPCLQPHHSPGILPSPLPSPSLTASPTQPSPGPVLSLSSTGSSLLETSSELSALLPSPLAQPAPPQPLRLEDLATGKLGSLPHSPSASLGLAHLQSVEHKPAPAFSVADWQGPGTDSSPHLLLAFPLLSSARVHF